MERSEDQILSRRFIENLLSAIRQGDCSITDYFTKLRIIWDELENYRPNATSTCVNKCTCDALLCVIERKTQDHIMQFFRGLNDQFINVRSQILMMDPLPIIYKTFSYIVQQERHIMGMNHIGNLDSKDIMINAASSTSNHRCSFCGKAGHTEDICYRKHGFPSSSKRRGGLGSNNMSGYGRGTDIGMSGRGTDIGMSGRGTKLCTHCGRYGHTVEVCYRKHGFPLIIQVMKPIKEQPSTTLSPEKIQNMILILHYILLAMMLNSLHSSIKLYWL